MKSKIIPALLVVLTTLTSIQACAERKRSVMEQTVRKPAVAGQFYTGDPASLRKEVERYMKAVEHQAVEDNVVSIVSPHAGYMYSGQVAAYGYRLIEGKQYETVVVISPSHVEHFDYSSVFPGKSYLTPLGEIPIDQELTELIASRSDRVRADTRGHLVKSFGRGEHALEVQLPFLQVALGDFKLVAIVMGDQNRENIEALGNVLGETLADRNALIVASTDLSHFHSDSNAKRLDSVFQDKLGDFDPAGLLESLARNNTEACGGGPTVAAMIASRKLGATSCRILHYANSGDVSGDTTNVVGYVSAVMLREKGTAKNPGNQKKSSEGETGNEKNDNHGDHPANRGAETGLSDKDKVFLLSLVRDVIKSETEGKKAVIKSYTSPVFDESRGGFVTLKIKGKLRGCIGYIEAIKPLITTIEEMARAAAFNDYRFPPVTAGEVKDLQIEISILSPIESIDDPSVIEVGKHGIIITRGPNRGLLLPQVATEWDWDRETFLRQTCMKAGLPEDAWEQPGTRIEIFSAEIFSEREMGLAQ